MKTYVPGKELPEGHRPGFVRRWLNRIVWLIAIAVVAYVSVGVADYLSFRLRMPVGFYNGNWSGTWQSSVWGISGRLVVRLPDPLPENEDFKAEALVYYPIYSAWKTGQFVKMDFQGRFDPDQKSSSGGSTNEIPGNGSGGKGGKFTFKAVAGNQTVEYVAILDDHRSAINGGFVSQSPSDHGRFWIRYY